MDIDSFIGAQADICYFSTAKMVQELADVSPDMRSGFTPLSWAAKCGNEAVVRMLLEKGRGSPSSAGENGETPLFIAACEGHEGVVKMLLEQRYVSPNTANRDGETQIGRAHV